MKKNTYSAKTSLIVSVVIAVLLLVLIPFEIYAWFSMGGGNAVNSADGISLGVVTTADGDGSGIGITIIGGSSGITKNSVVLTPENTVAIKVTMRNATSATVRRHLTLSTGITYPTSKTDFQFQGKHIFTGQYVTDTGAELDESTITDPQNFIRGFIRPITDAVQYALYTYETLVFNEQYVPAYLSQYGKPSESELLNPSFNEITNNAKILANPYTPQGDAAIVDENGAIIMPPNSQIDVYLLFKTSSTKYVTENGITLENSNPYMEQSVKLEIGFADN